MHNRSSNLMQRKQSDMTSITQPYASRYSQVLSLVEAHLLEARRNRQELPKSRFTAGLAEGRKRDGRDGFWAVLDQMAGSSEQQHMQHLFASVTFEPEC